MAVVVTAYGADSGKKVGTVTTLGFIDYVSQSVSQFSHSVTHALIQPTNQTKSQQIHPYIHS